MKGISVRQAVEGDAAEIASVLFLSFKEFQPNYTATAFQVTTPGDQEVRFRMKEGPIWIALCNGDVLGTVSVTRKEKSLYVRGMAVHPNGRRKGIGRLLLNHVENFAIANSYGRMVLSTTPFLTSAIRLYEDFGFKRIAEGPNDLFGTPLFSMEKILAL